MHVLVQLPLPLPLWRRVYPDLRLEPPTSRPTLDLLLTRPSPMSGQLRDEKAMGKAEPVRSGDYVLWDPRLPHTTGEPDAFSRAAAPRQVCSTAPSPPPISPDLS